MVMRVITYTYREIHAHVFQHLPPAGPFSFPPIARRNGRNL